MAIVILEFCDWGVLGRSGIRAIFSCLYRFWGRSLESPDRGCSVVGRFLSFSRGLCTRLHGNDRRTFIAIFRQCGHLLCTLTCQCFGSNRRTRSTIRCAFVGL